MLRVGFLLAGVLAIVGIAAAAETSTPVLKLFPDSEAEFSEHWEKQGFPFIAATEYEAHRINDQLVVTGRSQDANRALLRNVEVTRPTRAVLAWQWRARGGLPADIVERTKAGDDFSARVFVVFETSFIPSRTRAINYVWAVNEPIGAMFRSPYTAHVAHIVLRSDSGDGSANSWQPERRDVLADYEAFFGEPATKISGVAIMVDTDNSDSQAEADFTEMFLEISPAPQDSSL